LERFDAFLNGGGEERYPAGDLPLARACLDAAAAVRPTFKAALDALDAAAAAEATSLAEVISPDAASGGSGSGGSGGGLARVGAVWALCQGLGAATTSLGNALYPPLVRREVRAAAAALLAAGCAAAAGLAHAAGDDQPWPAPPAATAASAERRKVSKVWAGVAKKLTEALDAASDGAGDK
jgi:hypothetical protein